MKKLIILISCLWMATAASANNVVISNISIVGATGNFRVKFDLSWDNGWRVSTGQNNCDGVWVFFKFRVGAAGDWQQLNMNGTNNTVPANYTAYQNTGATKTGAVIHRTNDFAGTSTLTNIELGVPDITAFGIDIRGYAIEMVFIPQNSNCIIGDGSGIGESGNALHVTPNTSGPFGSVFSVSVNAFDDATLEAGIAINAAGITGNAAFATGQAMWSMKYEISEGAYRDFLNSLNFTQQTTRTANLPSSAIGTSALVAVASNRNFIEIATPGGGSTAAVYGLDASGNNVFNETNDGEWIACNFLSWMDLAAYLDWAGLAPMTEIGFERICRGATTISANPSVEGEKAWGTFAVFSSLPYVLSGVSTAGEIATNSSSIFGNANNANTRPAVGGALRNGIFATNTSNRETSGAAFYGAMEMSGNVIEPCVTLANVAGRGFTSVNGDGNLSINGNANTTNWPCGATTTAVPSCAEVTNIAGIIFKGGGFNDLGSLSVSDRIGIPSNLRGTAQGGRGVLYVQ